MKGRHREKSECRGGRGLPAGRGSHWMWGVGGGGGGTQRRAATNGSDARPTSCGVPPAPAEVKRVRRRQATREVEVAVTGLAQVAPPRASASASSQVNEKGLHKLLPLTPPPRGHTKQPGQATRQHDRHWAHPPLRRDAPSPALPPLERRDTRARRQASTGASALRAGRVGSACVCALSGRRLARLGGEGGRGAGWTARGGGAGGEGRGGGLAQRHCLAGS